MSKVLEDQVHTLLFIVSFIPYFCLLVFGIFVTSDAWFSLCPFRLAHLVLQNINKDYVIFSWLCRQKWPKTKNGTNETNIWNLNKASGSGMNGRLSSFSNPHLGNEQWIGLEKIYNLTNRPAIPMKLHIQMEDFSGIVKDAYYDTFRIENEVCSRNTEV